MEVPVMRTRVSSASADFDLETAAGKSYSHEEPKERTPFDYLKKASRLWLALAAFLLILFFCLSSSVFNQSPSGSQNYNLHQTGSTTSGEDPLLVGHRIASLDRVQSTLEAQPHRRHLPHHHVAHAAAQTHDSEGMTIEGQQKAQQHLDEEETDEDDNDYAEEDEEESHLDREYLAEAHSEYLRNEELDEGKQHPDEPEYIDIWDGVSHEDLHISEGVPGLKTPLYRLPFVDGQHNDTHIIGVHTKKVYLPRFLSVSGGKRLPDITGTYRMYMIKDGRPKPHLNHGRLIWQKEGQNSSMFLYYDHMHHTWVFNNELELRKPQPLAFLAHGAILPISKRSDRTFRKYGAPKSVHWIVRDIVSGDSRPDGTIKVEADPRRSGDADLQPLLLQKVYHAPEDGSLDGEGEMDDFELFEEEHEEDEDEEEELPLDEHGEPIALPIGARSFQQFITHLRTNVYHTFDTLHPRYDHKEILRDPITFVETNAHPDLVGPERLDGYSHDVVPHPLRKSIQNEEIH
ncbi:hypothetical protein, conserved [Eimeria maxima]|uniref:Uncharacterized protein n=1 Tax=Eimeria maxima TaxID=5804 RepID=U6MH71_EIMMA|nr:hypothetical protein, conserved [Eimeria maxima]CDJ61809.1 hypothetical protein, conserved [Eimeria maxima]